LYPAPQENDQAAAASDLPMLEPLAPCVSAEIHETHTALHTDAPTEIIESEWEKPTLPSPVPALS
jgi:hypothetical protein